MNLLLDTHVVLWWRLGSRRLSANARRAIGSSLFVYVSAASAWEVAIKLALGRLRLQDPIEEHVRDARFQPLPITFAHAAEAGRLPPLHSDPFDRMLVAQARVEGLTLVTHDRDLVAYDVRALLT